MKKILFILISLFLIPSVTLAACNTNSNNYGTSGTNASQISNNLGITGGNYSSAVWFKINTEPSAQTIYLSEQQDVTNQDGYGLLYKDTAGTKSMNFRRERGNVANDDCTYASGALGTTNWHRAWITYDGTNIRGYLDGALVAGPCASSGNGSGGQVLGFTVNTNAVGGTQTGFLKEDDIQVYSAAIAAGTISTDYSSPVEISCSTTNLKAYYTFDSDRTTDCTANAFNLTTVGTVTASTDVPFACAAASTFNGGDDDYMTWFMSLFN